jgi:hypothetical protein
MNKLERAKFDLEMILPYVEWLKKPTFGKHEPDKPELCYPGEPDGHDIAFGEQLDREYKEYKEERKGLDKPVEK